MNSAEFRRARNRFTESLAAAVGARVGNYAARGAAEVTDYVTKRAAKYINRKYWGRDPGEPRHPETQGPQKWDKLGGGPSGKSERWGPEVEFHGGEYFLRPDPYGPSAYKRKSWSWAQQDDKWPDRYYVPPVYEKYQEHIKRQRFNRPIKPVQKTGVGYLKSVYKKTGGAYKGGKRAYFGSGVRKSFKRKKFYPKYGRYVPWWRWRWFNKKKKVFTV